MNLKLPSMTMLVAGIETVVMRKHQVPLEPIVESEEQVPTNFVSMFMRQKRKYRRA